jgi:holo-[acyl-carrier protein] synthase
MTVLSVGIDLVDVTEFAELLAGRGSAFTERVFTPAELQAADAVSGTRRDQHLAARFAAKEALVKAWSAALAGGAPLLPETETWPDIEIRSDAFGRPAIRLYDPVAAAVHRSLAEVRWHLSLTHESRMAGAVVIAARGEGAVA